MAAVDLVRRDPNNLNDHVKVAFEDVLAEPDGAHSIDCVWTNSFRCFECSKSCCYKAMTLLCGIPLSLAWGCDALSVRAHDQLRLRPEVLWHLRQLLHGAHLRGRWAVL